MSNQTESVSHTHAPLRFALIGAAGYIAPRHLEAIKACGAELVAACDPSDSVGILDRYFPECAFFTEYERWDRHLDKLRYSCSPVDYIVVCSPNHLHDAHCRFGLRYGAHVICEKPVVLNPWNLDRLQSIQEESAGAIHPILQMRYHPVIEQIKSQIEKKSHDTRAEIVLSYVTPRGLWYHASWKGEEDKSGGVLTNIGVHLFDILIWLYGQPEHLEIYQRSHDRACGLLRLPGATISWLLSIDPKITDGQALRHMTIDGVEYDFTVGTDRLHNKSYQEIINGGGWTLEDASSAIDCCYQLRTGDLQQPSDRIHPLAGYEQRGHPFRSHPGA